MPGRNLNILLIAVAISLACYHRASHNRYAAAVAEAMGDIRKNYVEAVDRRELFEGSMRGMIRELDPYSGFVSSSEYEELLEDLDQEFGGVGIVVDVDPDSERLMVLSPLFDSPAYKEGLRAGDLILEIDGNDTKGLTANDTIKMIRGKPGTKVNLTILQLGSSATREVTLERDIIPVESILGDTRLPDGSWEYFLKDDPRIGYVRLTSFGENTARDLEQALDTIAPSVDALILDMRGNPGGLLDAAVDTCSLFIDGGAVVSIQGRGGKFMTEFEATRGTAVSAELPMVVMVDHYSASASEIVAACLQDHGRAKVIGERSWGKGTVQSVIPLEGGRSAMRLTTATYWRPSGRNIHRLKRSKDTDEWGVSPDEGFEIELERDEYVELMRNRRKRDVLVTRTGNKLDADSSKPTPVDSPETKEPETIESREETEPTDEPVVDRQLEQALKYLNSQIVEQRAQAA